MTNSSGEVKLGFSAAFLNCHDLFALGSHHHRGPKNEKALEEKIRSLAASLYQCFLSPPDLVGLCEVGSETVGSEVLRSLLPGEYRLCGRNRRLQTMQENRKLP